MLRRRPHRDPVDPELRIAVIERDAGCVAVRLGQDPATCRGRLTLDHIKAPFSLEEIRLGRPRRYRAPSTREHLVTLCEAHHLEGWATANRDLLRAYLARLYPAWPAWAEWLARRAA